MAKVEAYQCDSCNKLMIEDTAGFTFQGNVLYLNGGGLIGNNLSEDNDGVTTVSRSSHYCKDCTIRILNLLPKSIIR